MDGDGVFGLWVESEELVVTQPEDELTSGAPPYWQEDYKNRGHFFTELPVTAVK